MTVVVLDAGHGGNQPGAVGPTGLLEKDVCLAVCLEVRRLLQAQGIDVRMTRETDVNVALARRIAPSTARAFVSVHCNAFTSPEANGTETFHFPQSPESTRLAGLIQRRLITALGRRDRGVKAANFQVLRQSRVPAVLVELAFISNPQEEALLRTPTAQNRAAEAIAAGVLEFIR